MFAKPPNHVNYSCSVHYKVVYKLERIQRYGRPLGPDKKVRPLNSIFKLSQTGYGTGHVLVTGSTKLDVKRNFKVCFLSFSLKSQIQIILQYKLVWDSFISDYSCLLCSSIINIFALLYFLYSQHSRPTSSVCVLRLEMIGDLRL